MNSFAAVVAVVVAGGLCALTAIAAAAGGAKSRTSTLPLLAEWNEGPSEEISMSDISFLFSKLRKMRASLRARAAFIKTKRERRDRAAAFALPLSLPPSLLFASDLSLRS